MNQLEKWKVYRCECGHSKYDHEDEHSDVPTGSGFCHLTGCDCQSFKKRGLTLDELVSFVHELHNKNAIHRKRGFPLSESSALLASNHMIEETVELQAEACIEGHKEGVIEESSDVLATWLHLLLHCDVDFQEVIDKCVEKLLNTFTYDPVDVLTDTPGYSRRHRDPNYNAGASAIGGSSEEIGVQDQTG